MSNEAAKIRIENLYKSFGTKKVLRGVSTEVKKGESLVVIGGSGSGKSVLLKNILGLMQPSSGHIYIDGKETSYISEQQRNQMMYKFGMLFQGGALFDSLPVWHNVAFSPLGASKIAKKEARDFSIEKLKAVGLGAEVADLFPSELSGGMQKRVSLARAIADHPEIIFFDEPTTGLDPIMSDIINDLIIKCSEELGATTVTITHDMHSARKIANRVAMICEGEFIWQGKVDDLDQSGNEYVEQFIHGRAKGPICMKIQDH